MRLRWIRSIGIVGIALAGGGGAVAAQEPEPGASLTVTLITVGTGEVRTARFGHSAIRIQDASSGEDRAFTFGQSNFGREGFVTGLLHGWAEAGTDEVDGAEFLDRYVSQGRSIRIQRLNLRPPERLALQEVLRGKLGGFRYDFFHRNCTTQLRDALDEALGGRLRAATERLPSGSTRRLQVDRHLGTDPLLNLGSFLFFTNEADQPISVWEEMFLPITLGERVPEIVLAEEGGGERRLLTDEEVREGDIWAFVPESGRPRGSGYPVAAALLGVVLGLALGVVLAGLGVARSTSPGANRAFALIGGGWTLLVGLTGLYLLTLAASAHQSLAGWNGNLLAVNPLFLLLGVQAWGSKRNEEKAWRLALVLALLALIGVMVEGISGGDGGHWTILALALPAHLGLAWGFRGRRTP